MAQRRHHYEVAFEDYLRHKRIPYVAVDEARKALLPANADLSFRIARPSGHPGSLSSPIALKSFDFVVYSTGANLLIDVKGRKIALRSRRGAAPGRSRLESWVTQDDIDSLERWKALFGPGFDAAFVFIYWCEDQPPDGLFQEVFEHRARWYAVRSVPLEPYKQAMKPRSTRWRTVHVPSAAFERISRPFSG